MNKRLLVIMSLLPVLIAVALLPSYADQHKKEEVSALITDAQARLSSIKTGSSAELVRSEIANADASCALSQRLLTDGEIDQAYNEIMLCNLYFQMMDARIDLQKALLELDETKKNLSR